MEEITLNGIKYVKAKEIKKELHISEPLTEHPFKVGESWFMRGVTYHLVGKVAKLEGKFLVLENASWIADSGRFMNAIKEGKLSEVEPVGDAVINTDAIVDAFPWKHKLPDMQKQGR